MGETISPGLAETRLTERELIIHAVQHLEDISERLETLENMCGRLRLLEEIHAELEVFLPLLREIAPGGKVTLGGLMRARRGQGGGQRVFPVV